MNMTDRQRELFTAMRKAADDYVDGLVDGDELHSAVVDFTDSVKTTPKSARKPFKISEETIREVAHFGMEEYHITALIDGPAPHSTEITVHAVSIWNALDIAQGCLETEHPIGRRDEKGRLYRWPEIVAAVLVKEVSDRGYARPDFTPQRMTRDTTD